MTPALTTAQNGLATASKRFGAASTAVVAAAAYQAAGAATTTRAVAPPDGGQGGAFNGTGTQGGFDGAAFDDAPFAGGPGGRPPLPEGLVALLQEAGRALGRGQGGGVPSLEEASVESILAQRAFEASLRSFQAADRQLGDTLNLLA